ncbi:MAG: DNA primase [Planctomycetes bacterium]|nr:DNA primase [Planctomycetota bacterium]
MSLASPLDAKQQVREAVDIVDLVGDYLPLRREGSGYKALCPWHNDSRPSLQVNPTRQSFRCWVCDIGGDVFSFIMRMEGVSFPEALQMLADRAGISINTRSSNPQGDDLKRLYFRAMAWAEQQYHDYLLKSSDAQVARDYLLDRGLTSETIAKYRLGFAPEQWSWLAEQAHETPFNAKVLEAVGLVSPRQSGSGYYDRFRGRVLFPIRDPQGRPVALGGRVVPGTASADNPAKYVNSPETPLFSKSSLLYGLDSAKDALSQSRQVLVMEGYTDCLIARQFGFANAVAVLGTALGERHLRLLKRFVDRVYLVLDGDEAGRRRADQVLELFVAEQMDVRILTLPDELDPADLLLERGAPALQRELDNAVDALEHKFRMATAGLPPDAGIHAVAQAVENVLATLAKAPRLASATDAAVKLREDQILHRLAQRSGLQDARLRQRLAELRRPNKRVEQAAPTPEPALPVQVKSKQVLAERWLLHIVLEDPRWLAQVMDEMTLDDFSCPQRRTIYGAMLRLLTEGKSPTFDLLMLLFDDPALKSALVELDEERSQLGRSGSAEDNVAREIRDLLTMFRTEREERTSRSTTTEASARAKSVDAEADPAAALRALVDKQRVRQGISVPTDG